MSLLKYEKTLCLYYRSFGKKGLFCSVNTVPNFYILTPTDGKPKLVKVKGVILMARGEHFEHKKKGHPGDLPKNNQVDKHVKEVVEDEEFIVVQEAFKNRVEESD